MNLKNKTQLEFRKSNLLLSNSQTNINKNYFKLSSSYTNFIKNNGIISKPLSLTNYSDTISLNRNGNIYLKKSNSLGLIASNSTKNSIENLNFYPFNKKKEEDYTNIPLIKHIKKYNNRNKTLVKNIEEAKDKLKLFINDYSKIMLNENEKFERKKMLRDIEQKYLNKGYKLSKSLIKNNIFKANPLLMKSEKNMIQYFKSKNIEELTLKKFPKNNSENFLTNSYHLLMKNMQNNMIGDIEKDEFLKKQKLKEEIYNEKIEKKRIENEIKAYKKEIKRTKNTLLTFNLEKTKYNEFLKKARKTNFLSINNDKKRLSNYDSFKENNILTPSTTIFSFNRTIDIEKTKIKNQQQNENEKHIKLNKKKRNSVHIPIIRKKDKSKTLINQLIELNENISRSQNEIKRSYSAKHSKKKYEPIINLEMVYNYLNSMNENIKKFNKIEFKKILKNFLKNNNYNYNEKKIKIDKVNMYIGLKNLKFKIEENKIKPLLKRFPNVHVSKYFKDKLNVEAQLNEQIQEFEKTFLKIISKNNLEN